MIHVLVNPYSRQMQSIFEISCKGTTRIANNYGFNTKAKQKNF